MYLGGINIRMEKEVNDKLKQMKTTETKMDSDPKHSNKTAQKDGFRYDYDDSSDLV